MRANDVPAPTVQMAFAKSRSTALYSKSITWRAVPRNNAGVPDATKPITSNLLTAPLFLFVFFQEFEKVALARYEGKD